ncbi:Histone-lysine N-methyltransferase, H3 lysine-36 and H4 lysine-20 specific [Dermatophagoides farinae]|uniref:Histone-lysine N-methyltransferase, H3 lysine-36 and H4 lysine-20 specific n=1 Tax=Dermatophagoides farinae TaxID=6954 RepID=A0A922IDD3_DERFA|nr:Histone-lysine N-methyltransferase, H3 lysine-36 and H4 lysine-20 specific [Dermatophagoides farinae]
MDSSKTNDKEQSTEIINNNLNVEQSSSSSTTTKTDMKISEDHVDSTMKDDDDNSECNDEDNLADENEQQAEEIKKEESNQDVKNTNDDDDDNDVEMADDDNNDNELITRRSLRASTTANSNNESMASTMKQEASSTTPSDKRGRKRKSLSSTDSPSSKLPKYEFIPISLEAKTIVLNDNPKYIYDRQKLISVPPKDGCISVGDLIWAKMQGYPWWPCMVTVDPCTGSHNRVSRTTFKTEYHVQYFGPEPSRGYINESNIIPFEGYQQFRDKIEDELKDLDKKKRAKSEQKYIVRGSLLKKWNESISEAEEAMDLNREDRLELLNFNYVRQSDLQISNRSQHQQRATPSSNEDVYAFDDDDAFGDSTLPTGFVFRKRLPKGDFNVYLKRHLEEEIENNSDLSKSEVIKKLKEKWSGLDEAIRSIYVERKAIYEDESNMLVSKRSNFDDDYFNDDDSDYDYNDSDSDRNGFGFNDDQSGEQFNNDQKSAMTSVKMKSRRTKSRKSEKLFDKIKNQDHSTEDLDNEEEITKNDDNDNIENNDKSSIVDNGDDTKPGPVKTMKKTPGRKSRNNKKQSDLNESQQNDSEQMKTKSLSKSNDENSTSSTNKKRKSTTQNLNISKSSTSEKKKSTTISLSKLSESNSSIEKRLCFEFDHVEEDDSTQSDTSEKPKKIKLIRRYCHHCGEEVKKDDKLVTCKGDCERMFHLKCNKYIRMIALDDGDYICDECQMGKYRCFACKNPDDLDTQKCEDKRCKKYYHLSCLEHYYPIRVNEQSNSFVCPLHSCITCHLLTLDDDEYRHSNRKLMKCILCPVAYHANEICIGAGTMQLPDSHIICQDHYEDFNTNRNNRHINVNYCMACIKVGNLICCERCPAAFHEECLEYKFDHEKNFYCQNCLVHKHIHYGEIVWVKLGQYRWWPGRIVHPNQLPDNVSNIKHSDCEFPVYFYGSHDYYWVNKGRTFLYMEDDNKLLTSNSVSKNSSKLIKSFNIAIREASEEFEKWKKDKVTKNLSQIANKPPPYQHIWTNRYVSKSHNNNNSESNYHVCDCKPENPCGDSHNCLNRISLIECDPKKCPTGEKCQNQRFRKLEYVKCKPFRTASAGWGLRTLEDVEKDRFVIEYCGEVIDEKECRRRLETKTNKNFYYLTLDRVNIIDAGPKGNLARFMNHSCDPNCVTQKWMVNGATRCGIFALKDIPAGTELTFNYNLDCYGFEQMECKCGSDNCTGFIGGSRPNGNGNGSNVNKNGKRITNGSSSSTTVVSKSKNGNGTKSTNNNNGNKSKQEMNESNDQYSKADASGDEQTLGVVHENVCFKCGENADSDDPSPIIHCNHRESNCTKTYHLKCLNKSDKSDLIGSTDADIGVGLDPNNWICPRHICMKSQLPDNSCNEPAFLFCSVCPNSLCKQHASTMTDNLQLPDNQFLCGDHRISDVEGGLIVENEFIDNDGDDVEMINGVPE